MKIPINPKIESLMSEVGKKYRASMLSIVQNEFNKAEAELMYLLDAVNKLHTELYNEERKNKTKTETIMKLVTLLPVSKIESRTSVTEDSPRRQDVISSKPKNGDILDILEDLSDDISEVENEAETGMHTALTEARKYAEARKYHIGPVTSRIEFLWRKFFNDVQHLIGEEEKKIMAKIKSQK